MLFRGVLHESNFEKFGPSYLELNPETIRRKLICALRQAIMLAKILFGDYHSFTYRGVACDIGVENFILGEYK